jgi:hypothetical protein
MKSNKRDKTMLDKIPKVKWVKRANMWCVSEVKDGKQIINWYAEKPEMPS